MKPAPYPRRLISRRTPGPDETHSWVTGWALITPEPFTWEQAMGLGDCLDIHHLTASLDQLVTSGRIAKDGETYTPARKGARW